MRVLVVDDDKLCRTIICQLLKVEGFQVDEANDGGIGLEMIKKNHYDLVITDLVMDTSGFRIVEWLYLSKKKAKLIIVTGSYLCALEAANLIQTVVIILKKDINQRLTRQVHHLLSTHYSHSDGLIRLSRK